MKVRFPIYVKVLAWFFLNLMLIGAIGAFFLRDQFALGLDSMLAGAAGERIQALADQVVPQLRSSADEDWDAVLAQWSSNYAVTFLAYTASGQQIAGAPTELPAEVRNEVTARNARGRKLPPMARPRRPRPEAQDQASFSPDDAGNQPPDRLKSQEFSRPPGGGFPRPGDIPPRVEFPRFTVRTSHPTRYWVGLRVPLMGKSVEGRQPVALLMKSETLSAGGLFFDTAPWLWFGCGTLAISMLLWIPFVRGLNNSLGKVTEAANNVSEGRFNVNLDERRADELGQLSGAINRMAGRLEGFVDGQRRFLGAIAHELCSPLARLQMALGILEQRADPKQKPHLDDLREEIQHMSDLVNELLSFSKASLKPGDIKLEPVSLAEISAQAAHREAAGSNEVQVNVPADLHALANRDLLQRALSNLVRNSLRYAAHKGPVEISARREGSVTRISVADHGPGIPDEHLKKVFDTFYRIEPDRGRETGGVGLGLSIVRSCVDACGGTVRARNRQRGGLRVIIELAYADIAPVDTQTHIGKSV